jgi:Putative adhesin Stv domain
VAPITVDPEALTGAGKSIGSVGDEIAAAVNTLASGLAGGAPTGLDDAGLAFGISYQQSAQALLDAAEAAVNAGRGIGFGVQMSATNYSRADAGSTVGGGTSPLTAPAAPGDFSAPACPPSLGGGVPPPFLWGMVQAFIPDVWPDGDPARLTAAATAWDTFATTLAGIAGQFAGPSGVIGAQQIPEGGNMTSAISELSQSLSQVASEAGKLATQTREFADDVAQTQNSIRDLLDRVSPSGFLDGIKAVLSGDALEELKEIAEDIKTVLCGFGRQVEGRTQLLQQLIDWIDGSVVSMQKWARKEFTHYLGEDVGGLAANAFEFQTNFGEGFVKAGLESIQSIQQLDPTRFAYDFDGAKATWGALADTAKYADPMYAMTHPIGAFEHGKDMLSGLVHSEDWRADRPGLGAGGLGFEVVTSVTGVGAAKTASKGAIEAAEGAAARAAPEVRAMSGTAAEVSNIGENVSKVTEKLDNLDVPTGGALPGSHGPTIPPSLTEPKAPVAPHIPDTPGPRGVPEPTAPHAPSSPTTHVPNSTPVDRSPSASHSSTPTSTPTHAPAAPGETPQAGAPPIGATPESRVPATVEAPSAPHQSAPAPTAAATPHTPPTDPHGTPAFSPRSSDHSLETTHAPLESRPVPGDGRPVWPHHENASPDNGMHSSGGHPHDAPSPNDHDAGQGYDSTAPDGRIKFSGHGSYDPADGEVALPSGTSVTVYAEHGSKITDALGNLIETGGDASRVYSRTFYPGETVPNYTLHPPEGLNIHGAPYTVEASTQLSNILRENMGDIDFAACLYDPTVPTNRVFDVDGIYDETDGTFTHIYEKPEDQTVFDDEDFEDDHSTHHDNAQSYYDFDQSEYTDPKTWDYNDIDFEEF